MAEPAPWEDYQPPPWQDYGSQPVTDLGVQAPPTEPTPLRPLAYGPIVGEHTPATTQGPLGALGEKDVAVSPNRLKEFGGGPYRMGQSVDARDAKGNYLGSYRIADSSWYSPGKPTTDTIEFRDRNLDDKQVTIAPAMDGPWREYQAPPSANEPQQEAAPDDGMISPGNLDPYDRPVLSNPDGTYSTTSSISIGTDKGEVVIPTVIGGKRYSEQDAIAHYHATGENFGTFKDAATADSFAEDLHHAQEKFVESQRQQQPEQDQPFLRSPAQVDYNDAKAVREMGPAIEIPQAQILQTDSTIAKGGKAAYNTVAGFASGMTSADGINGLLNPFIGMGELAASVPALIQKVREADKTPANSPERWQAGAEVVGFLSLPAVVHGAAKLRAKPKPVQTPLLPNGPLTGQPFAELPLKINEAPNPSTAGTAEPISPSGTGGISGKGNGPAETNAEPQAQPAPGPAGTETATSQELSLADKIKRVAKESGADNPTQFNFVGGSAFGKYMKAWGDRLKAIPAFAKSLKRFNAAKPIKDEIAGTYDGIDNRAAQAGGQAASNVRLNLPAQTELADKAATFVRQANGDKAGMLAKLNAIKGKGYDDVISYVENNWDKLQAAADAAGAQTDAVYNAEVAAGVDTSYRGGYVKGVYEDDLKMDLKNMALDAARGRSGASTSHLASKVFNDYAEAIAAGYKPRDLRLSVLTQSAVHNGLRLVNGKVWVDSLHDLIMPDGKPVVMPMERIERRLADGTVTYLERPPEGYTSIKLSGHSLSAVHQDAATILDNLSKGSSWPVILSKTSAGIKHNMLAFDIYHGSRFAQMQMAFEGLLKPSYHKGLAVLDYSDADLPKAVKAGEISQAEADWAKTKRPIVEGGLKAGVNAGKISDALFRQSGSIFPYAKASANFIFGKLSRGIITQSYVYAFERNAKIHPDWTEAQTHKYTAREINTYYRNMGNQGLFQSKTMQDAVRTLAFAPQWFEGKARSEGRGYGQAAKFALNAPVKLVQGLGKVQNTKIIGQDAQGNPLYGPQWTPTWNGNALRGGNIAKGMGTGIVGYLMANQMVNYLTRGHSTFENPEHGHKLDAWIPDFIQGTQGFFHSPLGVFAEITHDSIKATEHGTDPLEVPLEVGKSQLGPLYSVTRDIFGGKDFYGRPLHGYDKLAQAFADAAPIPIGLKNRNYAGAAERNLFSFAGMKLTPAGSNVSNIYKLANDFMAKNDIKTDRGNEPSKYMGLRRALQDGRQDDALSEYKSLLDEGPAYMPVEQRQARNKVMIAQALFPRPEFTNSAQTEKHFRESLTRDQLDIYNAALREKDNIWQQFRALPK